MVTSSKNNLNISDINSTASEIKVVVIFNEFASNESNHLKFLYVPVCLLVPVCRQWRIQDFIGGCQPIIWQNHLLKTTWNWNKLDRDEGARSESSTLALDRTLMHLGGSNRLLRTKTFDITLDKQLFTKKNFPKQNFSSLLGKVKETM